MEGNSITSFENLCKIFEMRIKLDKKKGVKTSLDVLSNFEKYSKKIDAIYNSEFQKELKSLISPAVTLEKEEERLKKLIKLLEERLDRRVELEDRFYNSTGKYITGLQVIVSESELAEKKSRLSIISNYLETSREIDNINESLNKLKTSLEEENAKKKEYEEKNKMMEDELYSSFIKIIKEDDYYRNIEDDEIDTKLDEIRGKVSETKETLDITRESVGSLINSGLKEDYTSYVEEAEKNYYNYKNKEIILKIYKLVIDFEDDFKLICSKREKINELIEEKKDLKDDLTIGIDDELLSFEKVLLIQIKTLDEETEILENIANYTSRIKFKEERLEELNEINSSSETLPILREYGLVDTYDSVNVEENLSQEDEPSEIVVPSTYDNMNIVQKVYNPYRIVEVKDYPKSLNIGLAKLKGESVREKVNKKLNPKENEAVQSFNEMTGNEKDTNIFINNNSNNNSSLNNCDMDMVSSNRELDDNLTYKKVENDAPIWTIPTEVEPKSIDLNKQSPDSLPVWESVKPTHVAPEVMDKKEDINNINIEPASNESDMFWIPVSDDKMKTQEFPTLNSPTNGFDENDNFNFPNMNN